MRDVVERAAHAVDQGLDARQHHVDLTAERIEGIARRGGGNAGIEAAGFHDGTHGGLERPQWRQTGVGNEHTAGDGDHRHGESELEGAGTKVVEHFSARP